MKFNMKLPKKDVGVSVSLEFFSSSSLRLLAYKMEDPWESNPTAPPMARKRLAGVPDPGAKAAELVFAALE